MISQPFSRRRWEMVTFDFGFAIDLGRGAWKLLRLGRYKDSFQCAGWSLREISRGILAILKFIGVRK